MLLTARGAWLLEVNMRTASKAAGVVPASLLVGCAATSDGDYTKVHDRYNEVRLVKKASPGDFVGTSATPAKPARPAGQLP